MAIGEIYGGCLESMTRVMEDMARYIEACSAQRVEAGGEKLFEHLSFRIKDDQSMRTKLAKRGLSQTPENALNAVTDAIGLRVVCLFIDDVYEVVERIRAFPGCTVVKEKDYIRSAKPNGYRSYHMILSVPAPFNRHGGPERYFVEFQLRTIAMDTWAALEHELRYKKNIDNPELIARELHRCANELAACDVSMQTLRRIIRQM